MSKRRSALTEEGLLVFAPDTRSTFASIMRGSRIAPPAFAADHERRPPRSHMATWADGVRRVQRPTLNEDACRRWTRRSRSKGSLGHRYRGGGYFRSRERCGHEASGTSPARCKAFNTSLPVAQSWPKRPRDRSQQPLAIALGTARKAP
jgi:hypothetical protein